MEDDKIGDDETLTMFSLKNLPIELIRKIDETSQNLRHVNKDFLENLYQYDDVNYQKLDSGIDFWNLIY